MTTLAKDSAVAHDQLDTLLIGAQHIEESVRQFESFVSHLSTSLEQELQLVGPAFEGLRQEMSTQQEQLEAAIQRAYERLNSIVEGMRKGQNQLAQETKHLESSCTTLKQSLSLAPRLYDEGLSQQLDAARLAISRLQLGQESLGKGVEEAGKRLESLTLASSTTLADAGQHVVVLEQRLTAVQPMLDGHVQDFGRRAGSAAEGLEGHFKELVNGHLTAPIRKAKEEAKSRIHQEIGTRGNELIDQVVADGFKKVLSGVANTSLEGAGVLRDLKNVPSEMHEAATKLKWLAENMTEIVALLGKPVTDAMGEKSKQSLPWIEQKTGADLSLVHQAIDSGTPMDVDIELGADRLLAGIAASFRPQALAKDFGATMDHLQGGVSTLVDHAKKALEAHKG